MPHEMSVTDPKLTSSQPPRAFVILNAKSGSCDIDDVKREISSHFAAMELRFHELTEGEDLAAIVEEAVSSGFDQIVAGGGDGTISAVASLLVGSPVPLALLPLGTANVFARELNIPTDLVGACRLAASRLVERDAESKTSQVLKIDAMKIGDRHYLTQVGVGIDAMMIQNTSTESKRRLGRLAYMMSATKHVLAFKPHRFVVTVDGQTRKLRASQIVIANTGMMGQPPFRWGPDILPDDGQLNVCFIKGAGIRDYLRLLWVVFRGHQEKTPNMRHQKFSRAITIKSRRPLPVQADGEIWGDTPVTVEVIHHALDVIVPLEGEVGD